MSGKRPTAATGSVSPVRCWNPGRPIGGDHEAMIGMEETSTTNELTLTRSTAEP